MEQDLKQEWCAALRSGEYEQGRMSLNNKGKYCCLGVLADILIKRGIIAGGWQAPWNDDVFGVPVHQRSGVTNKDPNVELCILPSEITQKVGLKSGVMTSLVAMNDGHMNQDPKSFGEIADYIEQAV